MLLEFTAQPCWWWKPKGVGQWPKTKWDSDTHIHVHSHTGTYIHSHADSHIYIYIHIVFFFALNCSLWPFDSLCTCVIPRSITLTSFMFSFTLIFSFWRFDSCMYMLSQLASDNSKNCKMSILSYTTIKIVSITIIILFFFTMTHLFWWFYCFFLYSVLLVLIV